MLRRCHEIYSGGMYRSVAARYLTFGFVRCGNHEDKEMSHKANPDGVEEKIDNDPIQLLKREHREALRKLESANQGLQSLRNLPENTSPGWRKAEEAWIKGFIISLVAEICHHFKKEEEALFPILAEYIGKEHGPIEMMLHEHEKLRLGFSGWKELLVRLCEKKKNDKLDALDAVLDAGEEILCIFRKHTSKENLILFEICKASLSQEEKREVADRIEAIEITGQRMT